MTYTEIKGQLARLLASENLIIEHRVCETASFDVSKRVLTLPIWEVEDVGDRVYNLLVGHEVGHALFTPNDNTLDNLPCPKSYVNVTEDARIEKLMKRKFPGISKDFYGGYRQLNARDFFNIDGEDHSQFKLIDRINLYFKLGADAMMPFDADEMPLRDAVDAAETFEEAIAAAVAVYQHQKQEETTEAPPNSSKTNTGDGGEGVSEPMPTQQFTDTKEMNDQKSPNHDDGEDGDEADLETPSYERDEEAMTDAEFAKNLANTTSRNSYNTPHYMEIDDPDMDEIVVSADKIYQQCEEFWRNSEFDWGFTDDKYREFKRDSSREVNYLAKEFELKKSASAYARQSVSRTGVLDTTKLHTYKYNEDLFKKVTTTTDGKNHGLIFFLDWSGSMAEIIHDTYKQLLSLCLFCRKVGIPFDVYAFTIDATFSCQLDDEYKGRVNTFYMPQHFHLHQLLSSEHNNKTFDKYANYLWRCTYMYDVRYGPSRSWEARQYVPGDGMPSIMGLGGTPLNEAIVSLQTLIPRFSAKYGVEKTNVCILTDGEAQWSGEWSETTWKEETKIYRGSMKENCQIRNRNNGQTYRVGNYVSCPTVALLNYMEGYFPNVNILGFRIGPNRELNKFIDQWLTSSEAESTRKVLAKNKSVGVRMYGFKECYLISNKGLNDEIEFDVAEDATKAQIKTAFRKSLKGKANNKRILSSFIQHIA
jgi:hypothetical protein